MLELLEAGCKVADVANDLGISDQTIYNWRRQDRIDRGVEAWTTTAEHTELVAARKRIRELEAELAVHRRATELLKEHASPKGGFAAIEVMVAEGLPAPVACLWVPETWSWVDQARRGGSSARMGAHRIREPA